MNEMVLAPQRDELLAAITSAARDPSIETAKFQLLLETAERIAKFNRERDFSNSMRACQEEIVPIARTAENAHTGTPYTTLDAIDRAIRPVYTSHGFAMSFSSGHGRIERSVKVTCDVRHSGGHTVQYELEGELDITGPRGNATKSPIHGLGSTVTHLKRYLTMMIWNINLTHRSELWVSKQQEDNIRTMLDAAEIAGERLALFLQWAQAESIAKIPAHRYNEVMKMLKRAEDQNRNRTSRREETHAAR